jgi:la-related protein 1
VDQVSWPTPETTLVDEPRKKPQEKIEAEAQPSHAPKVKHAWEKVDFTPSVVFHTPLPGQARRGGKGGGRGVREGPPRTNATGQNDRRGDSSTGAQNGEPARRDRSEAARSASPGRGKRHSNDEGSVRRGSRQESLARGVSAKSADDIKSKPTDNVEQDAPKLSNTLRSKTSRKEQAAIYGERLKDETVGGKENSTAVQSKGAMPQPPTGQQASPTSTEFRKPDVSPAVSSERKGSVATDISSRNHERKNSASYSSYSGRPRPDRGRGGHRGGRGNGHTFHPNAHSFVNGQSGAFPIQSFNNLPKSPTGFGQDPFYGQTPQHSQRYGRNFPSRASSIPTDGSYPRIPNGYPSQPLQINTGVQGSGMYPPDYYMPATAVPYQNDPTSHLIDAVSTQMEYYFSVDNLLKDLYLRKHMDSQGFVLLSFIAEFKRLKSMTTDLEMIKYVCQQSPNIEHRIGSDGIDRLRAAKAWENWVLPKGERDRTAQHDGPDCLHQPPHPHPQLPEQSHLLRHSSLPISQSAGPVLGGQAFQSLNSFAAPYTYVPSASAETPAVAQFQTSPTNMGSSHSVAQPSAASSGSSSTQSQILNSSIQETEPDSFTDAEVDVLRVVFRNLEPADADSSSGGASHRTFSNGSAEGINGLRITTNPPARNSATPPSE